MHIYGVPSTLGPDVDLVECSFDAYLRFSRLFGRFWTADLMHIYGTPSFLSLDVCLLECSSDAYLRYSRLFPGQGAGPGFSLSGQAFRRSPGGVRS